jgi:hypothetical protein
LLVPEKEIKQEIREVTQHFKLFISKVSPYDIILVADWLDKNVSSMSLSTRTMYLKNDTFEYLKKPSEQEFNLETKYARFFSNTKKLRENSEFDCVLEPTENIKNYKNQALRRTSYVEDFKLKKFIEEHLRMGFIQPSTSNILSPFLFVKKDGTVCMCVDFRQINSMIEKDVYPLPRIDSLMEGLANKKLFFRIDIHDTNHQIRMSP